MSEPKFTEAEEAWRAKYRAWLASGSPPKIRTVRQARFQRYIWTLKHPGHAWRIRGTRS